MPSRAEGELKFGVEGRMLCVCVDCHADLWRDALGVQQVLLA